MLNYTIQIRSQTSIIQIKLKESMVKSDARLLKYVELIIIAQLLQAPDRVRGQA